PGHHQRRLFRHGHEIHRALRAGVGKRYIGIQYVVGLDDQLVLAVRLWCGRPVVRRDAVDEQRFVLTGTRTLYHAAVQDLADLHQPRLTPPHAWNEDVYTVRVDRPDPDQIRAGGDFGHVPLPRLTLDAREEREPVAR